MQHCEADPEKRKTDHDAKRKSCFGVALKQKHSLCIVFVTRTLRKRKEVANQRYRKRNASAGKEVKVGSAMQNAMPKWIEESKKGIDKKVRRASLRLRQTEPIQMHRILTSYLNELLNRKSAQQAHTHPRPPRHPGLGSGTGLQRGFLRCGTQNQGCRC
jgi:hypothetical protein